MTSDPLSRQAHAIQLLPAAKRNQKVLIVSGDHTLLTDDGIQGRWEFLNNTEVERKYRFTWKGGSFEDAVVLTKDSKSLSGKRSTGEKVAGIKLD